MPQLEKRSLDRDLVVLTDLVEDESLPQRDWEAIINIYNQNNKPFPISYVVCAKIIIDIKEGLKPKTVFSERGLSYTNFINRYSKSIATLEEISVKNNLTEAEWQIVVSLRNDPFFILGQDIERARSFSFNNLTKELRDISMTKPEAFLNYMKEFHSEEFEQKTDHKGVEVTINFAPGLLESV